ncbi:MAG TPA: bifunctional 3-phosphoshikimate 1-carboxyvinyltransferase/cytidylate kinase [Ramlibacter sp.]|nr:bifunctional 3-phosphoshikimate 1-carboxyvinyltransferase/cytidylate kinase [Ramlibacter sp.]
MFTTAFLDLPPLEEAGGTVTLPGSKSISNRVLLLAALSGGTTVVHDLLESDDTKVMLEALRVLGCSVVHKGKSVEIVGVRAAHHRPTHPDTGRAAVSAQPNPAGAQQLFLGNAGTAMRPLTAGLALMGGDFELSGVPRMHERPIGDLVDALRALGCRIDYLGNKGYPPLRIHPAPALKLDAPIPVRGDVSSQFLTALLMALPLVATRDIVIEVIGELISKPYIEITLNLLQRFGIQVRRDGWQRFTIPAGSRYQSPGEIHVEADASSASYFVALGAIAGVDEPVRIQGVGESSIQGDIRFIDAARQMGAEVTSGPNWLEVKRGAWPLKALDLDCNHIPDAAMTLAVMALFADGPTTLRNIASWRVKETDRIAAMATELRKLGAEVEEGQDHLKVAPPRDWQAAAIHTYDDHRVAMCFALAAFNRAGAHVRIEDPKCVGKTFPDFFETLFSVARTGRPHIPVICVDGPTASGKGTLASEVARRLGYHYLDSGALYRITGYAATEAGLSLDSAHEHTIARMAEGLAIVFTEGRVLVEGHDVTDAIRTEESGMNASKVSALPAVRTALVALQQSFRKLPGLVADGRDMGTVIFPDAPLKVYLTASAAQRAERRHKQLISKGISATLAALRADLEARDHRDSSRAVAPLKPAEDALLLDNSGQTVEQSVAQVLEWWAQKQPFKAVS